MDQKTIKEYIRALEHMTSFMRTMLDEELKIPESPQSEREILSEFTDLRLLAKSEAWPLAVPEEMICDDDEDNKLARAAGILTDFVKTDLSEKTFLDFGCGEGHAAFVASNLFGVQQAVGFDLIKHPNWDNPNNPLNLKFTNNESDLRDNFDIILANDVLDHAENPKQVLETIKNLKKPHTGKVFLRCHPWTSRSGTHIYKQLNRAYLHLVFNEKELQNVMGIKEVPAIKFLNPLSAYRTMIKDAGFSVLQEEIITQPVELFFTTRPQILRRIQECFAKNNLSEKFPRESMEVQFVDYVLI